MRDVTSLLPQLASNERAFEVEAGANSDGSPRLINAAVAVQRLPPQDGFLPVKVTPRWVDDQGAQMTVGGVPAVAPSQTHSIWAAGLADGTSQLENEVAKAAVEGVERLRRHVVALEAFFRLPDDPGLPNNEG